MRLGTSRDNLWGVTFPAQSQGRWQSPSRAAKAVLRWYLWARAESKNLRVRLEDVMKMRRERGETGLPQSGLLRSQNRGWDAALEPKSPLTVACKGNPDGQRWVTLKGKRVS